MADLFWLTDEQWAVLEPFMPTNQPGARRVDDRRVISGIVHVLKTGGRLRERVPGMIGMVLAALSSRRKLLAS